MIEAGAEILKMKYGTEFEHKNLTVSAASLFIHLYVKAEARSLNILWKSITDTTTRAEASFFVWGK